MLNWLKSLISARSDAERYKSEAEYLRAQVEKLEAMVEKSDARLLKEIESNRRREDKYRDTILSLKGVSSNQLPPMRLEEGEIRVESSETGSQPTNFTYADEGAIQLRAKEFYDQAIGRGHEVNLEDYVAMIRANPAQCLDN